MGSDLIESERYKHRLNEESEGEDGKPELEGMTNEDEPKLKEGKEDKDQGDHDDDDVEDVDVGLGVHIRPSFKTRLGKGKGRQGQGKGHRTGTVIQDVSAEVGRGII